MLCLVMPSRTLLKHVVRSPEAYLIPRSDGRLLVGATVEEAGFDKRTDLATIQRLHKPPSHWYRNCADAKILEDWAGLRPGTPDALPILGETADSRLLRRHRPLPRRHPASSDHRRSMADVIEGRQPEHDLSRVLTSQIPMKLGCPIFSRALCTRSGHFRSAPLIRAYPPCPLRLNQRVSVSRQAPTA